MFNPFPGLRPFESDEDHLFFGREKQIDELLRRIRSTRFLSVIGSSGSGKSSLVRSGLVSALYSGFMVQTGSSWRVAKFRPSDNPIGGLAEALNANEVLGAEGELASTNQVLLEATLRRGTLGLVDAVRQAKVPTDENLLILVDQFEDLFRFRRSRNINNSKDEATAFVKLLLEATQQSELPIYVALTMRSDFIGECMEFTGLPEAVNAGQYLIPRMTRDELRLAITGPVAVGGGQIAQRLVARLLNDLGEDQDQLPLLQHVLMRTWDYWQQNRKPNEPIDIQHYEAVGTLKHALSFHAEEAFAETGSEHNRQVAERLFKAITDTFTDHRGVRRPTPVRELAAICEAAESEIVELIDVFRRPGRSFLTPSAAVPLDANSVVDISHESLMRCWDRLIGWAEQERLSAVFYLRLSQAAAWFEEGTAGLWRDPELELGLQWKKRNRPTDAWADHYDSFLPRALSFLEKSRIERDRATAERERERKKQLRQYQWAACILGVLLLIVGWLGYIAHREGSLAELNLDLAQRAVNDMLSSAGRQDARVAADVPQMEEFRKELLGKAKDYYVKFTKDKPDSEKLRNDLARAHHRLGDIHRLLEEPREAVNEYQEAAAQFESLAKEYPGNAEYRQALGNAYNWLGVTLTSQPDLGAKAETAFADALGVQQELVRASPNNTQYKQELARSFYNRGILRYSTDSKGAGAESDFREAIGLLKPLADQKPDSAAAQELARAYNNLANVLRTEDRLPDARDLFERAIGIHGVLANKEPANREFKQERATFYNNLAMLLLDQKQFELAQQSNHQALSIMAELARPPFSLDVELAKAHSLRCQILIPQGFSDAFDECQQSLDILNQLVKMHAPDDFQTVFRDLGYNYRDLAMGSLSSGSEPEARRALKKLSDLLPQISEGDRSEIIRSESYRNLQKRLGNGLTKPQ